MAPVSLREYSKQRLGEMTPAQLKEIYIERWKEVINPNTSASQREASLNQAGLIEEILDLPDAQIKDWRAAAKAQA